MPNTVIQFAVQRLSCSECGAEANASCNCGKPYVPAKVRAAEAIKANPQKSDRAIADEIGVSHQTVGRAREEATGPHGPVEEPRRVGLDGKARMPPTRAEQNTIEAKSDFFKVAEFALRIADVDLSEVKPTASMRATAEKVIAAWTEAKEKMQ